MIDLANQNAKEEGRDPEEDLLFDEHGIEIKKRIDEIMRKYAKPMAKGSEPFSKFEDGDAGFADELKEPETVIHRK